MEGFDSKISTYKHYAIQIKTNEFKLIGFLLYKAEVGSN